MRKDPPSLLRVAPAPAVPLILEREPKARFVVACVRHGMPLASILRYRAIPVRIRSSFARCIGGGKGLRVGHAICEARDAQRRTWILVDPDRQLVDLRRMQFEFAGQALRMLRDGRLPQERYISAPGSAARATLHLLRHDLSYVLGEEVVYWEDPPIVAELESSVSDIELGKRAVLDRLAGFLARLDHHMRELVRLRSEHEYLQFGWN